MRRKKYTFRKKLGCCALVLCTLFTLNAADIKNVIQNAMANSSQMKSIMLSISNTNLSWAIEDAKDKISITISSGDVRFEKDLNSEPQVSLSPSLSVVFPDNKNNDNEKLQFSFGLDNYTEINKNGKNTQTYTPNINISKNFALDSYVDNREKLSKSMNRMQEVLTYKTKILQFQNSLIEDVIAIINCELSLKNSKLSYTRANEDYQADIISGNLTKGSLLDLESKMNLETKKTELQTTERKYNTLLKSFKEDYGIEYENIDAFDADAFIETSEINTLNGTDIDNSDIKVSILALDIANQNYEEKAGNAKSLKLGSTVNSSITMDNGYRQELTLSGTANAELYGSNYSVGAGVGAYYNVDKNSINPYVTINGKWSNKTTKEADNLQLNTLKNKVILAQINLDNKKQDYKNQVLTLTEKIEKNKTEKSELKIKQDYYNQILEKAETMLKAGLITKRNVEDASLNVETNNAKLLINALSALELENQVQIIKL